MKESLLCVITAVPRDAKDVSDLMRMLRAMRNAADALLLFCDLPDASAAVLPEDDGLIRLLQSGVMSLEARMPKRFFLLVRRRVWSDAARRYLGESQRIRPYAVMAGLMDSGHAPASFAAASFSPASLAARFSAVLFLSEDIACTPDVPRRMLAALPEKGLLRARVSLPCLDDEPLLARLTDFSLLSPEQAAADALSRQKRSMDSAQPLLCSSQSLSVLMQNAAFICPLWEEQAFVRRTFPSLYEKERSAELLLTSACRAPFFSSEDEGFRFLPFLLLWLPVIRLFGVFLSAVTGWKLPALLALIEPYALLHPKQLPCALIRLSFLPTLAVRALNAFFAQKFARSPIFRLRFPQGAKAPSACVACALALIPPAFFTLNAFATLWAWVLLWLCAPLLARSLNLPAKERIPLSPAERKRLSVLLEEGFSLPNAPAYAGSAMLAACAGCMLGFLEPDEAARRVQSLCSMLSDVSPYEQACALTAAEFLREHMGECDAALRELPAQIEAAVSAHEKRQTKPACLSVLLENDSAKAALFLPLRSVRIPSAATHPHTFLRGALPADTEELQGAWAFLLLCDAALSHPFMPIFWRSPLAAPYWSLIFSGTPR